MKKLFYFVSLACMIMFAGCSSDVDEFVTESNQPVEENTLTIGVSMPGNDDTRVSTEALPNLTWEIGDKITAVGIKEGGEYLAGISELTLVSGENTANAVFSGVGIPEAATYRFFYTGANGSIGITPDDVFADTWLYTNYDAQVQNGASSAKLKDCLLLQSADIPSTDINKPVALKLYNTIFKINVKNLPAIISDADQFSVATQLFFSDADIRTIATLKYNGKITPDADNFMYIAFDGDRQLFTTHKLIFSFTAKTADGSDATVKASVSPRTNKTYEYGKIYTAVIDYSKDQDANDKWTWTLPSANDNVAYSFAKNRNWTEEGSYASLGLWAFDENPSANGYKLVFDGLKGDLDVEIADSRIVSPKFTLKSANNVISYLWTLGGTDTLERLKQYFKIYIKEVGSADGWQAIALTEDCYPTGPFGFDIIPVENIAIDPALNGKEVQLSFTAYSKKTVPYDFMPNYFSAGYFEIYGLEVIGE